jgi:purine-nucleoside phosphorylase
LRNINEQNEKVKEAVEKIRTLTTIEPVTGMILGSGLGGLVDEFDDAVTINFRDIPHFPVSTVKGHRGEMVIGKYSGLDVVALSGRVHYYEGYTMEEVCFPLMVMAGLGIKNLVVTNAGGAINESFTPGDIVAIKDHINMMGDNPLIGSSNFINMTNAYDRGLIDMSHHTADDVGLDLKEGVYLAMTGPSYETPAEIRMARTVGADIVGMSTVPEVIMANSLGIRVLGFSMVTNMASGITGQPLSHEEVIETTRNAQEKFKNFIEHVINKLK